MDRFEHLAVTSKHAARMTDEEYWRTLFNLTAPRGPVPVVKIGTRTCYAVKDVEAAIDKLKIEPPRKE